MAGIFRGQGRGVVRSLALLLAAVFAVFANSAVRAQLYEQPELVIDPGMHTAAITSLAVDAAGRIGVTGSGDKTVRVWSLTDGTLLQTIRMPAGPGYIGRIYAVSVSPDGALVAAGGWTSDPPEEWIYLFEAVTGKMVGRIKGLSATTNALAFSPDGRYLAAGLGSGEGLRVFDRDSAWSVVFQDTNYRGGILHLAFAADGRLASTDYYDGKVRLYERDFKLVLQPTEMPAGRFSGIAFSPDGGTLAVTGLNTPDVQLLDGHSLAPLRISTWVDNGRLSTVTWSSDGKTLYAAGTYNEMPFGFFVLSWADAGRGEPHRWPVAQDGIEKLATLPDGRLLVAAQDPFLGLLEPDGRPRWTHPSPKADFRDQRRSLAVSADGMIVDFGFEYGGKSPLRFDLRTLKLVPSPPADQKTAQAKQTGLAVEHWFNSDSPTVDGNPIKLQRQPETSRSLAIHPDERRLVLGASWSLYAFDAKGNLLWNRDAPGVVFAVNISGDGRLVVAAYGDGTIRWHRMDDGRELLALYVLADKQNWVAWTPEGFYGATAGAFGVLQWHVNRGFDAPVDVVPVDAIPSLRRPDALALVLQELETPRALGIADLKAARHDVQIVTRSPKAPGARLHVLTIGISDYGDKARNLRLNFAARDARDVASALLNTQEGGLYAEVKLMFRHDSEADKHGIADAFAAMESNMTSSAGQDLAVVMFSGHGAMIDNQFYLVPYGADSSTMARLKADAIPATEFKGEIEKLAQHGRVLVLLDACRSAGLMGGPSNALPGAEVLKAVMNASNVTVLTSSTADKVSHEDEKWGHGAFTKALLDALSASDEVDTNHDGVISMSELTAYVARHLTELTDGDQQLGLDQRFQGEIFVDGL